MSNRLTNVIAFFLLAVMFTTAFLSMRGDSLTFDELAHIPAGYSYLTQQDYRVNPEHPPLIKDLSAVPLLFLNLNFPSDSETWQQNSGPPPWWVQFDLGTEFLFKSGNDPSQIVFFARLPMLFLLLALAWFTFYWARKLGGNLVGLGALFLFTFSPNLIAHGRLVTTDIGAALGAVVAIYFWLNFLFKPTKLNILIAALAFGLAMLLKFNLVLLIPFFALITVLYALLLKRDKFKQLLKYVLLSIVIGLIAVVFIIWPVYQFHVANYPPERQLRDTIADLSPGVITPLEQFTIQMSDKPILRPLAQYSRGVLMALQRASFGNTTYFLGEISSSGRSDYFPIINLLKVPLAFHLLNFLVFTGFAFIFLRAQFSRKSASSFFPDVISWIRENFTVVSLLLFVNIYWATATAGNLNIGLRHLLPIFPLSYILVTWGIKILLSRIPQRNIILAFIILPLALWYASSSLLAFPHYISYYNELGGGIENGYKNAVDSNYDWGQDFHRLLQFVEENNIEKIHLEYFGGENPEYWLGDKYIKLGREPATGWIAISVNQLVGGIAKPAPGFDQETGYYNWLKDIEPVARAGNSIFIYYIE